METDIVLAELDTALMALKNADIYQTKNILDISVAAEVYAKRQNMSAETILRATSIKVEALRQLGNMLKETPRNTGTQGQFIGGDGSGGATMIPPESNVPTLAELGLDKKTSKLAQDIASLSDNEIEKVRKGVISISKAQKKADEKKRAEARAELSEAGASVPQAERWNVWQADIETWNAPRQYDFIITDPPYPREYLPLYGVLAKRAVEWLKPGGLLIAMCGQSYLDEVYKMLSNYLPYYWTAAYLTPGQPTPLRTRNVNSSWKPLLFFGDYDGKTFGDVFKSDANDKDFHKWGQSVSGMYDIVNKICLPGHYILDPFCGAGTTGIAALRSGCLFDGIDIDEECVNISRQRIHNDSKA